MPSFIGALLATIRVHVAPALFSNEVLLSALPAADEGSAGVSHLLRFEFQAETEEHRGNNVFLGQKARCRLFWRVISRVSGFSNCRSSRLAEAITTYTSAPRGIVLPR